MDVRQMMARWKRHRDMSSELRQYSTRELSDLGIARADIDTIAADAARR
jgi:uncharacterized protein YjiS (DUF1127 family)